jgi:hypothetical protein
VQFVINHEEGAELNILDGDNASESLLSEFGFAMPRIGARYLPVESMYEYGQRVGFWRLHKLSPSEKCLSRSTPLPWRWNAIQKP